MVDCGKQDKIWGGDGMANRNDKPYKFTYEVEGGHTLDEVAKALAKKMSIMTASEADLIIKSLKTK